MNYDTERQLIEQLKLAWDDLDAYILNDLLADDMVYSSHWVFDSINGRKNFLDYLSGKFNQIAKSPNVETALFSTPTFASKGGAQPALIITQKSDSGSSKAAILIKCEGSKIKTMDMTDPRLLIIRPYDV